MLDVRHLRIERHRPDGTDTIVSGISLSVAAGETIGIVGESGSGKSMSARAIIGLLPPTLVASGEILYDGCNLIGAKERRWRSVRGSEIGLIMQDPFTMLNPVMRCGKILEESITAGARRKASRAERRSEAVRRLAEVGIHDETVVERYPFQLSGGMRQRVGIAAALARDPRLLIADEPSTALDVTTQKEILALLRKIQHRRGMGLIMITHDLRIAFGMCDRIYVLYAGSLVEVSPSAALEREPFHPYSHGLLLSEPPAERRVRELIAIPGSVPSADEVANRCTFSPRCRWAQPTCLDATPPLVEVAPDRFSACLRVEEIRPEMAALRERVESAGEAPPEMRRTVSLVATKHASKIFPSAKGDVRALDDVTIEVGENESVGLVGESGSGKTTLSRILVGLETATSGTVVIDGIDVTHWNKLSQKDRRKLRGTIQIVFQDPYSSLNPMRTIGSTLSEAVTTHRAESRNVSNEVTELLKSVGLPESYARRKPVALSGGERQRVAIARALAVRPRVLICDEPVSALDVSVQAQVLNLFASLRREHGLSYLFIAHDLSIVRQIVEHVYVMHHGRVVESGPVEQVLLNPKDEYTIQLLSSVPRSQSDWLAPSDGARAGE